MKDIGFVDAGDLKFGDELLDTQQNVLIVEDTYFEICDEPVTVYNFEVEDFHTYHVGDIFVLVHNADYITDNRVPDKAKSVLNEIQSRNGAPPNGYKGGRTYKNNTQKIPTNTTYKEYDVNPYIRGQNRGTERIVVGENGTAWYTNDHYETFTKIE